MVSATDTEDIPRFKVAALIRLVLESLILKPAAEESRTEPSKLSLKNGDDGGSQVTKIKQRYLGGGRMERNGTGFMNNTEIVMLEVLKRCKTKMRAEKIQRKDNIYV